jgi:hypothetical protein
MDDPQLSIIKKYHHHGGAVRRAWWHGYGINSHPPPATSLRWVDRGRVRRNLFNYVIRLRKKLFSAGINFILFFTSTELDRLQNDHIAPPLRSPPATHHLLSIPRRARVFLVGCCVAFVVWRPSKVTTYFFFHLLSSINSTAKQWHGVHPTRSAPAASPTQCPSHLRCRLMVGCCVPPSNGGHLRLTHPPPLSFLSINSSPQTIGTVLPRRSAPAASPLRRLP